MQDRLLQALRREPLDRPPAWFMRQAGRVLPSYRAIRREHGFQEIVEDPELAAEVTALPLERWDLDAAVVFSDLSTPFHAAGLNVEIRKGVGPVVDEPITRPEDLKRLTPFDPREELGHVLDTITRVTELVDVPVVGFVGAPFTLCSYLAEVPRSKRLEGAKRLMWSDPDTWEGLLSFWAEHLADYGKAQVEAGASVVQVFDSWAGVLSPRDYVDHVQPHSTRLLSLMEDAGVPTIHFAQGNPALLPHVAEAGGTAVSVDWRQPLDAAWDAVGRDRAIQGNLDPTMLLAGEATARAGARDVLARAGGTPGHVFNLGHGLLPGTDPTVVEAIIDEVHSFDPEEVGPSS